MHYLIWAEIRNYWIALGSLSPRKKGNASGTSRFWKSKHRMLNILLTNNRPISRSNSSQTINQTISQSTFRLLINAWRYRISLSHSHTSTMSMFFLHCRFFTIEQPGYGLLKIIALKLGTTCWGLRAELGIWCLRFCSIVESYFQAVPVLKIIYLSAWTIKLTYPKSVSLGGKCNSNSVFLHNIYNKLKTTASQMPVSDSACSKSEQFNSIGHSPAALCSAKRPVPQLLVEELVGKGLELVEAVRDAGLCGGGGGGGGGWQAEQAETGVGWMRYNILAAVSLLFFL